MKRALAFISVEPVAVVGTKEALVSLRSITFLLSKFIQNLLKEFPWLLDITNELVLALKSERSLMMMEKEASKFESVRFGGRSMNSVETHPDNEKELVKKLMLSFNAAKKMQANITAPYWPSGGWRDLFSDRWKYFYECIKKRIMKVLQAF
jgi:hypothetical protein